MVIVYRNISFDLEAPKSAAQREHFISVKQPQHFCAEMLGLKRRLETAAEVYFCIRQDK